MKSMNNAGYYAIAMKFRLPKWAMGLGIFLGVAGAAYAGSKYNLVKDGGFEQLTPKTTWKEIEMVASSIKPDANSHSKGGYESDYCGLTNTSNYPGVNENWAELTQSQEQGFSPRKITELESLNLYYKYEPHPNGIANFGIMLTSEQGDTLAYQSGGYGGRNDTTHYKVINLDVSQDSVWSKVNRNVHDDWINEKLPDNATISGLSFYSMGYKGDNIGDNWKSQKVEWDDVFMTSSRFDHDVGPVTINYVQNTPVAAVRNAGAFSESFPTKCDIFHDGNKVYSDIVSTTGLQSDSTQPINFKPYAGQADSMVVFTSLAEDQNPANDTMSRKLEGIEEKVVGPVTRFRVTPTISSGAFYVTSPGPVTIYDGAGREIDEFKPASNEMKKFTIRANGVYFVESNGEVKKVVKVE